MSSQPEKKVDLPLLNQRIVDLRRERFGQRGKADMARTLQISPQRYQNYETGAAVPADIIERLVRSGLLQELRISLLWLVAGEGPKHIEGTGEVVRMAGDRAAAKLAALGGSVGAQAAEPSARLDACVERLDEIRDLLRRIAASVEKTKG